MLIYSLLLNDAGSRTYEMGMLRAMGMKRRMLVQLLLTRSALFSIAGISIGLLLAFIANAPLAKYLADFAAVPTDYALLATPLLVVMTLNPALPLVSNIVPISRALVLPEEEQGRSLVPMDLASPSALSIAHAINETVEDSIRQSYAGYLDVLTNEVLHARSPRHSAHTAALVGHQQQR